MIYGDGDDVLRIYRKQAIMAAKDLCYGEKTIRDLRKATSKEQVTIIMDRARHIFL